MSGGRYMGGAWRSSIRSRITPVLVGLFLVGGFWMIFSRSQSRFDKMVYLKKHLDRRNDAYALAAEIRETPEGVDSALEDMRVTGGRSGGLASWILLTSSLTNLVEEGLTAVVKSRKEPDERRIEALRLLWLRTTDPRFLEDMYEMVRLPGGLAVEFGRSYLAKSLSMQAAVLKESIQRRADEELPMSQSEFARAIRQPGVLVDTSGKVTPGQE